jgi:hypothetical protein
MEPTTIIIVGVVCVGLGIIAGMLLNTLSDDNETSPSSVDEAPPGGRKGRYTPVARLWRERGAGTLVVEMDGKAMVSPEPLTDIQRERLEKSARDLRAWLGMGLSATEPKVEDPSHSDIDLSRVIPHEAAKENSSPGQTAAVTASVAAAAAAARGTPPPPPAQKIKDEPAALPTSKSIVSQIEDILQDMIAGTPLEKRDVHLVEDPTHGVVVKVGLERYEGIDSVPDPEVKKVIQAAVQEWEKTQ